MISFVYIICLLENNNYLIFLTNCSGMVLNIQFSFCGREDDFQMRWRQRKFLDAVELQTIFRCGGSGDDFWTIFRCGGVGDDFLDAVELETIFQTRWIKRRFFRCGELRDDFFDAVDWETIFQMRWIRRRFLDAV